MGQLMHRVICGWVIMVFLQGTLAAAMPGVGPSHGGACLDQDQAAVHDGHLANPGPMHHHAAIAQADRNHRCCPGGGETDCCSGDCALCGHCSAAVTSTVQLLAPSLRWVPGYVIARVQSFHTPPLKEPPRRPA